MQKLQQSDTRWTRGYNLQLTAQCLLTSFRNIEEFKRRWGQPFKITCASYLESFKFQISFLSTRSCTAHNRMNVLRGARHYSTSITRSASHAAHPAQVQQQGVKAGSGRNDGWGRADPSHHANSKLWRNLSLMVALPAVVVMSVYTYIVEAEHMSHPEHSRPPFVAYEYLRRRTKPFPWGDGNHSLFHNPWKNALPDGYETELPESPGHH